MKQEKFQIFFTAIQPAPGSFRSLLQYTDTANGKSACFYFSPPIKIRAPKPK
jgi:hypothetical protein